MHSYRKQLTSYLKRIKSSSSLKNLSENDVKEVFLLIRKDFISYKLDLEEFAHLCDHLWSEIPDKDMGTPFGSMLLSTAELSYYIRKANNDETADIVSSTLKEALTYKTKIG
ncbi:MAG: hypothetical protein UV74_C0002G0005 [Candidatus Woesebacteria bacterium GW2011_GWB1_43_14]|uniref:Uncharacterized protein n=1 Tax=Candidatus Woesebacteria bacterium GW2011_GWB1_43_14 TaxID=1618578 RepID=A0A0G1FUW6_9BACT|nr:MAG: hypothetical protein UV51_C0004G0052 [Candidatus Woesebacteria bacterium GW2011_GWC1_42_9]KKS98786.1 MAG: hypothetical protein UV74_C0002G0005 [Candidatus Woesebacteria bacterium GW2011_GWB1_43_14]